MKELALAAFAAATSTHVVDAPRGPRFAAFAREFDASRFLEGLRRSGFGWIGRSDAAFPALLRAVHDPPPGLFVRGSDPSVLSRTAVAIVGARACSPYGAQVARALGRELAAAGVVVVSGLARGVDGEAHRGALEACGVTVAVLGCGIDRDYPASHRELARRIVDSDGLVVSEYAPGVEPAPWRFPARNRIVAGLAVATVVVEARESSGALITADFALEEGREVFGVPGEITSALSAGSNSLLRIGATPLTSSMDVFESLGIERAPRAPPSLSPDAEAVLAALRQAAAGADELARATGLAAGALASALADLELGGLAAQADGVYRPAAV
jgi:DNA processing protein